MKLLYSNAVETGSEQAEISSALGRVLSEKIISPIDVPHFNRSAMDGYAVRAEDTFGASETSPKNLKVIESISAGMVAQKALGKEECIGITTGAKMPEGADASLMVEYTEKSGDEITARKSVAPGQNVIKKGSDLKKGETALSKGDILTPAKTGVLSALGLREIKVKKKPKVAVIGTGDEIVKEGPLPEGKIYDINTRALIDALKGHSCEPADLGVAKDDKDEIRGKISGALESSDLILISGGSSLGTEDLMVDIVNEMGGETLAHGIAVKPGKPTIISKISGKLVLGLPGHPTSSLSNFYIIVKPLIAKMLGTEFPEKAIDAELERKVVSTIGRYTSLPMKVDNGIAIPIARGSSAITSMSKADGFVGISENTEVLERGAKVKVLLF